MKYFQTLLLVCTGLGLARLAAAADLPAKPEVWMMPSAHDKGQALRELFAHPDQWAETRGLIDGIGCTDLNFNKLFTDDELRPWFAQLNQWRLKLALEVGAIKPWGRTGEKTFTIERPMWERIEKLGGKIHAIGMDEPLLCCREHIHESDAHAVRETAAYIALVRKYFPDVLIGDIETFPSIPVADHAWWIDALNKRLSELNVRGLDFYRLDVNWVNFTAQTHGSWREVRQIELECRNRKLPFSLIYWASGYPALARRGVTDDSTWYTEIMQQGYDYVLVDGAPDQLVIESWIAAPAHVLPETELWTFTRSVRDFVRKFVRHTP